MSEELDIETDDAFQKKDWRAERIMWFILLIFVLAGIIGFFGRGGISTTKTGSANQKIEATYQRFLRYHTKDRIDITIYDLPENSQSFSLEIDKAYTEKVHIEDIHPEPQKTVITEKGTVYFFNNHNATQTKVIFYLHPDKLGRVETDMQLNENQAIRISQYIYP